MESCYTQFCERTGNLKKTIKSHCVRSIKAGKEMEVDWAGGTLTYVDTHTGIKAGISFCRSTPSKQLSICLRLREYKKYKLDRWHVRAYEYFGGVPEFTIPDNTKTAVIKPDRIDPLLNKSYHEMQDITKQQ